MIAKMLIEHVKIAANIYFSNKIYRLFTSTSYENCFVWSF